MSIHIEIQDETGQVNEEQIALVKKLLHFASTEENVDESAEVSVTFVSNETIKEINREYRQKDYVTDVISFALNDDDSDTMIEEIPNLLGDIIISYEKAIEQAEEYQHSLDREVGFLAVHGFLHLLGYDHMNESDEKEMFTKQEEILKAYGLQK
ncbi:MAG: rRNA maturation RNase YbeY [Bacillaceae bacterium]|nr:rRNA maturation RNase YbeY [Bacillaceae bacterium]